MLLLAVASVLAVSCVDDDDRIFDESSAQRMNGYVADCRKTLVSAEYGWAIDFYPYNTSMGGYALAARFDGDKVTMCAEYGLHDDILDREYPAGTEFVSLYEVKGEQSALLTFDTYNTLIHYWSEPFSDESPNGYMSDYEFMIMRVTDNEIVLRGKKYGNTMRMTRLTMPCSDYIHEEVATRARQAVIPRMRLVAGGRSVGIKISGTVMTLGEPDDNGTTTVPFTYTATGLRLYEPVSFGGTEMLDFRLDASGNLVSGGASIPYPTPAEIFVGAAKPWYFDYYLTAGTFDMCDELRDKLLDAERQAEAIPYYKNRFVAMTFGKSNSHKQGFSNYPECIGWEAMQPYRYEPLYIGYDVTFEVRGDNEIGISPIGPGAFFLPTNNPNFNQMLTPLVDWFMAKSPYRIVDGDTEGMKMESVADPSCWFRLTITNSMHWFD